MRLITISINFRSITVAVLCALVDRGSRLDFDRGVLGYGSAEDRFGEGM